MDAVVIDAFGQLPTVRSVPDPQCPAHGVVVEVRASGVCRSDWHAWMGHDDSVHLPHVPGHELAGVIAEVGPEVTRWKVGDAVTCPFVCACGDCDPCRRGDHQVCDHQTQPGFTQWGSFAERVALDHADLNLIALPEGMSFEVAASLGCRFATAYRALNVHGRIWAAADLPVGADRSKPGKPATAAIFGCGGLGLAAIMIAAASGAEVIAIDVNSDALQLAKRLGATTTINSSETPQLAVTLRELTGGGVDVTLDAFGSKITAAAAIESLRPRGRHIQAGLLLGADAAPSLPIGRVIAKELQIHGTHGMAAHEYPEMLARISSGQLRPQLLLERTITLAEAPEVLAAVGQARPQGITVVSIG